MSLEFIGIVGILIMFLLMFLRIPIAISMALPAVLGIYYLRGWGVLSTAVETIVWDHSFNYTLITIPMFIFMGELLFAAGISSELFSTFRIWFGKLRGGLAMATIGSSAIFAAASGSSLATTGTMGVISSKEMQKANYAKTLSGGSIVAGGTLGILIPPSTILIIYGMLTEQSIGSLLIAGIVPGVLLTVLFIFTIILTVKLNPKLAPIGSSYSWKERISAVRHIFWVLILFLLVIGGMYLGLFSPTEAAGVGAFGSFLIALIRKKVNWEVFLQASTNTVKTTGFLFAIILASFILNYFLALTRLPMVLASLFNNSSLSPGLIFLGIVIMYILLGAVMDTMAMIVVTIPIVLPVIEVLDFNLIWFGVVIVLVIEMALISPPIGMNCFVLNGVASDLKLESIFKGSFLFMIPIIVTVGILYFFPEVALYLPNTMK
ncbi:TRAP transporter, DctM subunit [Thalassobacillus cyri]|uniref:TRAP transporter, DctM subunit n=1 Tax=Thalassobacillus cyri TaxID=571932 RepID=A0A1H4A9K1_9BACI|nr:TRAP transporter large permease [Thalassobacillus cyri]SEA32361.1 TRAP transporter, DctM subunit [Thalassobacillus cyri]